MTVVTTSVAAWLLVAAGLEGNGTTTRPASPAAETSTQPAPRDKDGRETREQIDVDWLAFPDPARFGVLGLHWFSENQPALWRLPKARIDTLPTGVNRRCRAPSGGRILIHCDTANLALRVVPSNSGRLASFDVYIDGGFAGNVVPAKADARADVVLFKGLNRREKEILIYLPTQQEVIIASIGVDPQTRFSAPKPRYARPLPVVFYGSSVCQGSGASKPGMTYEAILGRDLNLDFINLGFGGAGKAEPGVVDLVNAIPACCYVFDLGKSYGMQDGMAYQRMLRTVRDRHPGVPIVCITPITSAREKQSDEYARRSLHTRAVVREAVNQLLQAGAGDLYLVEGADLLGFDDHDLLSKDGVHPSDDGYSLIARRLSPVLKRAIGL